MTKQLRKTWWGRFLRSENWLCLGRVEPTLSDVKLFSEIRVTYDAAEVDAHIDSAKKVPDRIHGVNESRPPAPEYGDMDFTKAIRKCILYLYDADDIGWADYVAMTHRIAALEKKIEKIENGLYNVEGFGVLE